MTKPKPGVLNYLCSFPDVSFHPSGGFLLSSALDATVKVWDLREGRLFYTLFGHEGATLGLNFSPAGDFFASGGADDQVMVWKTNFDRDLQDFTIVPAPEKHSTMVTKSERLPIAVQEDLEQHKKSSVEHLEDSSRHDNWVQNVPEQEFHGRTLPLDQQPPGHLDDPSKISCPGVAKHELSSQYPCTNYGVGTCNKDSSGVGYTLDEVLGDVKGNSVKLPAPLDLGTIPQPLAATLQHVIGELNVVSQTLGMVVERLTINEDRVRRLEQTLGSDSTRILQEAGEKSSE